jgi:hypothetical protein
MKTNGITDEIFLSVIFTDKNNFVSNSVGNFYQQKYFTDGLRAPHRRNEFVSKTV